MAAKINWHRYGTKYGGPFCLTVAVAVLPVDVVIVATCLASH